MFVFDEAAPSHLELFVANALLPAGGSNLLPQILDSRRFNLETKGKCEKKYRRTVHKIYIN